MRSQALECSNGFADDDFTCSYLTVVVVLCCAGLDTSAGNGGGGGKAEGGKYFESKTNAVTDTVSN